MLYNINNGECVNEWIYEDGEVKASYTEFVEQYLYYEISLEDSENELK